MPVASRTLSNTCGTSRTQPGRDDTPAAGASLVVQVLLRGSLSVVPLVELTDAVHLAALPVSPDQSDCNTEYEADRNIPYRRAHTDIVLATVGVLGVYLSVSCRVR